MEHLLLSYFCPTFESPLTLVERFVASLLDEKLFEGRTACFTTKPGTGCSMCKFMFMSTWVCTWMMDDGWMDNGWNDDRWVMNR